jgi:cytochrome c5
MKKLTVILAAVALTGCFTAKKIAPSQTDVDRMAAKFPGYTLAELNEGKGLYEANCGTCHALKKPTSEPESEWRRIVPDMVRKVNKNGMVLDNAKEERILKYLITMSGR